MLRTFLIIAAIFYFSNVSAQRYFRDFVDSTVCIDHFSEKDWAIALDTWAGGYMPTYDSLGNIFREPEMFSTIVVYNIKDVVYMQRFNEQCYTGDSCFHASSRVQLPKGVSINFTVDSIKQAEKEWIYQYIYKNDDGAYIYQEDSPHSPSYKMTFFSRDMNAWKSFTKICFTEILFSELSKNLNYNLNINTFTYRALCVVKQFIADNRKLIPLD